LDLFFLLPFFFPPSLPFTLSFAGFLQDVMENTRPIFPIFSFPRRTWTLEKYVAFFFFFLFFFVGLWCFFGGGGCFFFFFFFFLIARSPPEDAEKRIAQATSSFSPFFSSFSPPSLRAPEEEEKVPMAMADVSFSLFPPPYS